MEYLHELVDLYIILKEERDDKIHLVVLHHIEIQLQCRIELRNVIKTIQLKRSSEN